MADEKNNAGKAGSTVSRPTRKDGGTQKSSVQKSSGSVRTGTGKRPKDTVSTKPRPDPTDDK